MEDTIAAVATAYGEGGIGIIRISGSRSLEIMKKIFVPACDNDGILSRRMYYGVIRDDEEEQNIDEVLCVYMKGPKTYTAEDVVEINCHGSMVSLRKILALVLRKGARMAEPGEFTKRAFLNGRIDLSQAEAVIDVVKAKTDQSFDVALSQLEGGLSLAIEDIRSMMLDTLVDITVNIDYPDEDIEELTYDQLDKNISQISDKIDELLSTAAAGRMVREGIRVAIVGKPNVGKSSLMNGLLRENRAIVTQVPGTTRDTIEEAINIRNIPVYLVDTAGIRETSDEVEKIGIERSKDAFNRADFIIMIFDGSEDLTEEDEYIMDFIKDRSSIVLINKRDIDRKLTVGMIEERLPEARVIETALVKGEGIDDIEEAIEDFVFDGKAVQKESLMVNNVRHIDLLERARKSLSDAAAMTGRREALDFIEIDIRSAYDDLGEITGDTVNDDILNEVFSRFCLGK